VSVLAAAPGILARRSVHPVVVDGLIVVLLFLGSAIWASTYWNRSFAKGMPFFYQTYFEPAVMIACGKGFVVAHPQVPAMTAFLEQRQDRFSCDAIPAGTVLDANGMYQAAWRYLLFTVGFAWRILGISWSGLGPLFGALFGATIAAIYAVCRLGMGRLLAAICAIGLSASRLHLAYLPGLRDYAKAPFTLVLVFLLGLLVTRRPTRKGVLTVAAVYGVVLGVGYGFRTDFLAAIPPFFVTVFGFLQGKLLANLRLKAAAAFVFVAAFYATAWPVVQSVSQSGGCGVHAILLGFPTGFSRPLGLVEGPYKLMRVYSDNFALATVSSYEARLRPGVGVIGYCRPEYDAATARYLRDLSRHFPADMIVRGYAAALRVVELPFSWNLGPQSDFDNQRPDPGGTRGYGLLIVASALILATIGSVRIGLFLLWFLIYFGGYPAAQFHARHYFHLEFITWWAAGFVIASLARRVRPAVVAWRPSSETWHSVRRAALTLAGCAAALTAVLWAARAYQQVSARAAFETYLAASKEVVPLLAGPPGALHGVPRTATGTVPETADFLQIDVNRWLCGAASTITLRYDRSIRREFARRFDVKRDDTVRAPTRIFTPIYDHFQGIEMSDVPEGCVQVVYRARHPSEIKLMLEVVLPPRWRSAALYQRFGEVGPPELDAVY
jgi:hypothetical protein